MEKTAKELWKKTVEETATKPKIHKQTARRGIPLDPAKRNLDRKTLQEMKRTETLRNQMILGEVL